ncbi:hypothetical protein AALF15_11335 [Corynebacteriaceae bacterium 7-707]
MVTGLAQTAGAVDLFTAYSRNGTPLYKGTEDSDAAVAVTAHGDDGMTTQQQAEWIRYYLGAVKQLTAPGMVTAQTRTVLDKVS